MSPDFEALVQQEIQKGCVREVAAQRVIQKYGRLPDTSRIAKAQSGVVDFMKCVDTIMKRDGCGRTQAMSAVRREHPDKYQALGNV